MIIITILTTIAITIVITAVITLSVARVFATSTESKHAKINTVLCRGHSRAKLGTGFFISCTGGVFAFDAGFNPDKTKFVEHVFITHTHVDHIIELFSFIPRKKKITIHVPKGSKKPIMDLLVITFRLGLSGKPDEKIEKRITKHVDIVEHSAGETFKIKSCEISVFKCFHGTTPTIGFGITDVRRKLKPEFIGKSKEVIINARKSGIAIDDVHKFHEFVFLGDTNEKVFEDKSIFKFKTIFVECTHFTKEDRVLFKKKNIHMHFDNLEPIIRSHPETTFVLIHPSSRHELADVDKFFRAHSLKNMIIGHSL